MEAFRSQPVDFQHLGGGIDNPIFPDPESRIGFHFGAAIAALCGGRKDFNHQVWCAAELVLQKIPVLVQDEE